MSEPAPVYVTKIDSTPRMYCCKECGVELGTIRRRKHEGRWITYLARWGDAIFHGEIRCSGCGNLETWTMNQGSFDALMNGYNLTT